MTVNGVQRFAFSDVRSAVSNDPAVASIKVNAKAGSVSIEAHRVGMTQVRVVAGRGQLHSWWVTVH